MKAVSQSQASFDMVVVVVSVRCLEIVGKADIMIGVSEAVF